MASHESSSAYGAYRQIADRARRDPEGFWLETATALEWQTSPSRALDERGEAEWRWFPDGELNVCANALDRHVAAGRGEDTALIYDSAMTGTKARFSYATLRDRVAAFAGVWRR